MPLPGREEFERRLVDRRLHDAHPEINPLAVGSDKIACAAFKWAQFRMELNNLLGHVVFGFPEEKEGYPTGKQPTLATFETYPGAFVNINLPEIKHYKGGVAREQQRSTIDRRRIWEQLKREYKLSNEGHERVTEWIEYSQKTVRSDAFDALLCACAAWDYLRWRSNHDDVTLTTPDNGNLLGAEWRDHQDQVQREGWILVREGLREQLRETENRLMELFPDIIKGSLAAAEGWHGGRRTVEVPCDKEGCTNKCRIATSNLHRKQRCTTCRKEVRK